VEDAFEVDKQLEAMVLNVRNLFQRLAELGSLPQELAVLAANVPGPYPLAYLVASNLGLSVDEAQEILETGDVSKVLELLTVHLNRRLEPSS